MLIIQLDHKKWSYDNAKDLEQTSKNVLNIDSGCATIKKRIYVNKIG